MIVLADNDIIYKLSCCQLLPEFLMWLKSPPAEIHVLSELPFVVRRRLKNNPQALKAFELFLKKVKPLPEVQFDTLASLSRFDVGEQMLLGVLCENKHVQRFITGDKRALRLMADTLSQHQLLRKRLNDIRTDCFESTLLGLAKSVGFEALRDKVFLGLDSDKVLAMTFGAHRDEAHMYASLDSYIDDIQRYAHFVSR